MKATTTLMIAFLALSGVALAQPYVVVGTITYHDIFIGAFGLQPNTAYTVSLFNSAGSLVNSPYSVTTNATGALQGASGEPSYAPSLQIGSPPTTGWIIIGHGGFGFPQMYTNASIIVPYNLNNISTAETCGSNYCTTLGLVDVFNTTYPLPQTTITNLTVQGEYGSFLGSSQASVSFQAPPNTNYTVSTPSSSMSITSTGNGYVSLALNAPCNTGTLTIKDEYNRTVGTQAYACTNYTSPAPVPIPAYNPNSPTIAVSPIAHDGKFAISGNGFTAPSSASSEILTLYENTSAGSVYLGSAGLQNVANLTISNGVMSFKGFIWSYNATSLNGERIYAVDYISRKQSNTVTLTLATPTSQPDAPASISGAASALGSDLSSIFTGLMNTIINILKSL